MDKKLIILGNGFDLSCGLASKYKDFFNWRLQSLFGTTDFEKIREELETNETNELDLTVSSTNLDLVNNIRYGKKLEPVWPPSYIENHHNNKEKKLNQFTINKEVGWKKYESLTRWDVFFIYAQKYLKPDINEWQDVENIINNVVTIALTKRQNGIDRYLNNAQTNLHYIEDGKNKFEDIIYKYSGRDNSDAEEIAYLLLFDLINFEKEFSRYIYQQLGLKNNNENKLLKLTYFNNAEQLLKKIIRVDKKQKPVKVSVISFNYTLGPRFQAAINDNSKIDSVKINSWKNIHGLACFNDPKAQASIKTQGSIPAPIFGVDPEDALNCRSNARVLFTKPYRLIINKIKNIQQMINLKDIQEIIVYGHSLGDADYSYFKYIFDQANIYDNSVNLIFYYWPGEIISGIRDRITEQELERKYTELVVKMLNKYGKTSKLAQEDIVTKLALEGRLSILPNPNIDNFKN